MQKLPKTNRDLWPLKNNITQIKTVNPLKGRGANWLHFAIQI